MWLFYYFSFERNYDILRSKISCFLLNRNINLTKTKRDRRSEIPQTLLERRTLCFTSYKNHELKVKLWWFGARQRRTSVFFKVYFVRRNFFKHLCFTSLYIVFNKLSEYMHFYLSKKITSYKVWSLRKPSVYP